MDVLESQDMKGLISKSSAPFVSICQPTHRTGTEVRQSPIRLKNLIREAEEKIKAVRMGSLEEGLA
jgi:hypothetical protein